jgi:4-amino-4-deoxy-L-arabinose transferase-like glycosyltransferase
MAGTQTGRKHLRLIVLVAALLVCLGAWLALPWIHAMINRDYDRIEPGLYLGEAVDRPPRGTQAVVNLCGQEDPYRVEHALWDPVLVEGRQPDLAWLERVTGFIAEQRGAGRQVYVHCQAGQNRSATAVIAFLMQEHGWESKEALVFVQARRPIAYPDPRMMRLLAEWGRHLAARRAQPRP